MELREDGVLSEVSVPVFGIAVVRLPAVENGMPVISFGRGVGLGNAVAPVNVVISQMKTSHHQGRCGHTLDFGNQLILPDTSGDQRR